MRSRWTTWVAGAITALCLAPAAASAREEDQNWYGIPVLPALFQDDPAQDAPSMDQQLYRRADQPPTPAPPLGAMPEFPKLLSALDIDAWREKDYLTSLKEWAGEAFFGLPLLVPQLLLEEFIPNGVTVGPTAVLYKNNSKDSKSMPFVVFDQALFHEAQFLAQVQAAGDNTAYGDRLTRSQRNVLRRSLMTGFRASYALPSMSMDLIMETAAEQGLWAYLVAPVAGGALLFLKGIDQKISIDDVLKARLQVTSGRQWLHAVHSTDGLPVLSAEMRVADLPVAIIVSFEMSDRGMVPQFIGLGTSLDVVEDLLGREENRNLRPNQ